MKWLLYLAGGFLLAAALHFARPAASALERPLQVRGFHVAREILFALGFLLVVLLLSEPFLAQESQRVEFPFRLRLPTVGSVVPAGTPGVTSINYEPTESIDPAAVLRAAGAALHGVPGQAGGNPPAEPAAAHQAEAAGKRRPPVRRRALPGLRGHDHLADPGVAGGDQAQPHGGLLVHVVRHHLRVGLQDLPSAPAAPEAAARGGSRARRTPGAGRRAQVRHAVMNRSILIVICDFLLVSLLAFSTVDINKTTSEGVPRQVKTTIATNQARQPAGPGRRDAAGAGGGAQRARPVAGRTGQDARGGGPAAGAVERAREAGADLPAGAATKRATSADFPAGTAKREQQTTQLEQQQTNLLQQFAAAQTNIQTLSQQLQSSSTEALISKEKLAAMQAELRKQAEQAAALQQQLGHLAQSNQLVLTEKQRLAGQLQVAEAEKRMATEQVARMQEEVKVERAEKAKLAEGVKALASRSDQLAQEIQQNRPLAPNTIFNQFVTNRVQASFSASRSGFLGTESNKRTETQTVLVTDGTNTVALCHVQDTPLSFGFPGTDWEGLTGTLGRNTALIPIRSLSFYQLDPRVVFIPVTPGGSPPARRQGLSHLVGPLQVPGCGAGRGAGGLLRGMQVPD